MKTSMNHFKRLRVPLVVMVAIGMIAGTFCITYPISISGLTPPEHRLKFPYIFLSATISWEPAKTLGSFVLSMGAVPFTLAIIARKLELDLRRTQLPRKEAPIGEVPGVCDDHALTETVAFALHAVSVTGALGVCAAQSHVYKGLHIVFASMFFLGGSFAALCQTMVDYGLGNTCSLFERRFRLVTALVPSILAPIFVSMRGCTAVPAVLFAAIAEILAMAFLCAYYLSWVKSFTTFTLVIGAVDHRSGLERGVSGDVSEWDDEEGALLGLDPRDEFDDSPADLFFSPSSAVTGGSSGGGGRSTRGSSSSPGSSAGGGRSGGGKRDGSRGGRTHGPSVWSDNSGNVGVGGGGNGGGYLQSQSAGVYGVGGGSGGGGGEPSPLRGQQQQQVHPFRHQDGRIVNGLRASPATPGVPRVDSSDRIYQQLHEPFMRKMELEQSSSRLGG